ncbi:MAG: type 1 glutamine amidotransferase [Alphaproteobacteria bacterium]|nr:type 1 glutamine amidotransferase [Alphaproteobacteria bacterium]
MKIAIVETGEPPLPLRTNSPGYATMMVDMLSPLMPAATYEARRIFAGEPPFAPTDADAFLVTGSPAGVYEDHDWIAPLFDAIRATADAGKPQVGICFGHQAMAAAFGGRVAKSDRGWGVGVHRYEVTSIQGWMTPQAAAFSCAVSHQDQVVEAPAGAVVIAGSAFCPNGALAYADGPAISFQMHPEFSHDYARDLLTLRADRIPADRVERGLASLQGDSDRAVIARWIASFYAAAAGRSPS